MDPFSAKAVRGAYEAVAEDYEAAFAGDLDRLPVDRAVLDQASDALAGRGPVLDVGCGPGQVGRYVAARGVRPIGVDLAPGMLGVARRGAPDIPLAAADMRSLPVRSDACAGVIAFYSLQHLPRQALGWALGEFRRVLQPRGVLVVATHLGEGEFYGEEFLGHHIDTVGGTFYRADEFTTAVEAASFTVELSRQRGPLPHEHPSERLYVMARLSGTLVHH
jgi:ubiquinone/menaquinone biosynthesis C-methylase UbiE